MQGLKAFPRSPWVLTGLKAVHQTASTIPSQPHNTSHLEPPALQQQPQQQQQQVNTTPSKAVEVDPSIDSETGQSRELGPRLEVKGPRLSAKNRPGLEQNEVGLSREGEQWPEGMPTAAEVRDAVRYAL